MLKKIALAVSSISSIFMVACSSDNVAGGTIDPNSIAEASSSSERAPDLNPIEMSSSAGEKNVNVSSSSAISVDSVAKSSSSQKSVLSSSSSADKGSKNLSSSSIEDKDLVPDPQPVSSSSEYRNLLVQAENFSLQCKDDASDSDSPSAKYYVYEDAEVVRFENVNFAIPCDVEQRAEFLNSVNEAGANVGLDGNTIYVNFMRSKGLGYGCSCVADAGFKLPQYYPGVEYAVFDQQEPLQMKEIDNKTIEDVQGN